MNRMLYELSLFVYFDAPYINASVKECIEQILSRDDHLQSENSYVYLANKELLEKMDPLKYQEVVVEKYVNDDQVSGVVYYVFAYRGKRIVAIRGSEAYDESKDHASWIDWEDNFRMHLGDATMQQIYMQQELLKLDDSKEIIMCGHSKGGNLALFGYISMKDKMLPLISKVVTYNACGLQKRVLDAYMDRFNKKTLDKIITLYENENDLVSCFFEHIVKPIYVKSHLACTNAILLLHNHNLYSMCLKNDKFVRAKKKSSVVVMIHYIMQTFVMGPTKKRVNTILDKMIPYLKSNLNLFQMYQVIVFQISKYSDIFDDTAMDEVLTIDFVQLLKMRKHFYLKNRYAVKMNLANIDKKEMTDIIGDLYESFNQRISSKIKLGSNKQTK